MRLNQFYFLIKINEYRSISKAANALFTSQPAISLAIQELEKELGFQILFRTSKGVRFTTEGELVLAEAEKIVASIEHISQIKLDSLQNMPTSITIGCDSNLASFLVSDVSIQLRELYPSLTINSQTQTTLQTIKFLSERTDDLAIIHYNDFDKSKIQSEILKCNLQATELFQDELCFAARPQHPLFSTNKPLCLEQVFTYPFLVDSDISNIYIKNFFDKIPSYKNVTMIHIEETGSQRYYLNQSNAVQLLSHFGLISGNKIFQDTLKPLPIDDFFCAIHFCFLTKMNTSKTIAQQTIISEFKNYSIDKFL